MSRKKKSCLIFFKKTTKKKKKKNKTKQNITPRTAKKSKDKRIKIYI